MSVGLNYYRSKGIEGGIRQVGVNTQPVGVVLKQEGTEKIGKAPRASAAIKGIRTSPGKDQRMLRQPRGRDEPVEPGARLQSGKLNLDDLSRCGGLKRRSGLGVDPGYGWYGAAPRSSNEIAVVSHYPIQDLVSCAAREAAVNGLLHETKGRATRQWACRMALPRRFAHKRVIHGRDSRPSRPMKDRPWRSVHQTPIWTCDAGC
jgi:hypothetical protein